MKFNFISNFKLNRSYRNLAVFYLLAMLVFSALYVCMLPADAAGPVFVGNETELRDAITNAVEPTIIALTADISLSGTTLNISADKDITLTSDSSVEFYNLIGPSGVDTITVANGGKLTLAGITVTHQIGAYGRGVTVDSSGTLILTEGAISGNTAIVSYSYGGGVYSRGNFTMSGGTIANNTANSGGGVYNLYNGNFTMSSGTISNNTATFGGGIYNGGTYGYAGFVMLGGEISHNTATIIGGGVDNYGGNVTMFDGSIFNNTSDDAGGIFNTAYGSFSLFGGVISNNTATADIWSDGYGGVFNGGGGVYNNYDCDFLMAGGEISGNIAVAYGGGVQNAGNFIMSDGSIFNNTAASGGGIYNGGYYYTGSFSMSNGEIFDNTAIQFGGGIYHESTEPIDISHGSITNNVAGDSGGGIYIGSDGVFTMFDGVISNNSAVDGGGIYLESGQIELYNGLISDNTASVDGGGVWVAYANLDHLFVYDGMVFSNNSASVAYDRNPIDDALYYAQIGSSVVWTTPFIQGYNNYDIGYTNGTRLTLGSFSVTKLTIPHNSTAVFSFISPETDETFTLTDGESWDSGTLLSGVYTVIELPQTGWNLTGITIEGTSDYSIDLADGAATFSIENGTHVTLNYTNTIGQSFNVTKLAPPGYEKQVVSIFGIVELEKIFNLTGGGVWSSGNLPPGNYTLTELPYGLFYLTDIIVDDPDGGSYIDLSTGTVYIDLDEGETINIIYKNKATDSLQVDVIKAAYPEDPSTTFTFQVLNEFVELRNGENASFYFPGAAPGLIHGGWIGELNIPPGWELTDITVETHGITSYDIDLAEQRINISWQDGGYIAVTFHNTYQQSATVNVTKQTNSSNAQTPFNFSIDSINGSSFSNSFTLTDGATWNSTALLPGTYVISEAAQGGWNLTNIHIEGISDYTIDLSTGTLTFTIEPDQNANITFVNEELAGSVTVLKQTLPLGALTQFNFTTTAPGGSFTLADGETWSSGSLFSGTYVISELAAAGWDLVDIVVQGASNYTLDLAVGSLVLYLGVEEDVFVTFINGEQERPLFGSISVIKAAYPSDTQTVFTYVTSAPGGIFTLVDGAVWDSGPLAPGDYVVTELGVAGWDLTNIIVLDPTNNSYVDLASRSVFIVLDPGETISILYQNTQQASQMGSINVVKTTCPTDTQDVFNFVTSILPGTFSLTDGATWSSGPLAPGNYTLTEIAQAGWDLASIIIDDPTNNSRVDLATRSVFIALDPGETISILYQNSQQVSDLGSFSVTKVSCPVGSSEVFSFVTSAPGGSFSLTDGSSWSSGMIAPGVYTVTELVPPGWGITNILLNDPSGTSIVDLSTGTATIHLQAGTHVSIVYQDVQVPSLGGLISVVKVTCPTGASTEFSFVSSVSEGVFSLGDGEVWSSGELVPGRYFVTEVLQAGWVISDIVVVDPSGTSNVDLSTGTAFINLQAGTHVTILYQNTEQIPCVVERPCEC